MHRPLAVILGAGPGIGMAVARRFAQGGFRVAAVSRPGDPLADFQAALEAETRCPGSAWTPRGGSRGAWSEHREQKDPLAWQGSRALVLGAHLAQEQALAQACAAIQAWGGLPEALVYNASAGIHCPAADLEPARLLEDFRVNVGAPLEAVQWALPAMRRAGRGTLLFTGGGLALAPKPGLAAAAMGKAALRSLALSLAEELAPEGIHAATVTIRGYVQPGTPLAPDLIAQVFWEMHLQKKDDWTPERTLP